MKKTNENKPGYKHTPFGWIPINWEIKELGKIAYVTSGGTPDRKNKEYWNGDIPWITTSLINFNYINSSEEFITKKGLENSASKIFEPGTILMAMYGQGKTRGKVGILNIQAATNQACAAIILKEKNIEKAYLLQYLIGRYKSIRRLSNIGNQENLNGELIKSINILVPPIKEQLLIVRILKLWDKIIEKTQQLLSLKEQRKKALMQKLLTGKKRLPGFKDRWKETHLGELFIERNETGKIDLPLLSITADKGVIFQTDSDKKDNSNEDKSKYKRICAGDIGYNTMRMWQGRSALSGIEGIVSPAYTIIIPNKNAVVKYFSYLFKTESLIQLFFKNSQGLVADTLNCKFHNFATVKVTIPDKEEQTAITSVLQTADKELNILKQKLEALKEQKEGLMQKLLTGQIRIKIKNIR